MFFSKKTVLVWIIIISILCIIIIALLGFPYSELLTAVLASILASFAVSAFYNLELHIAMDKYAKIGLKDYYHTFEAVQDKIRKKIDKGKKVDIFLMYGSTFFSSNSQALQNLLKRKGAEVRIFLYSPDNPFIESYGNHWGDLNNEVAYNRDGLRRKIEGVRAIIDQLAKYAVDSSLSVYEIKDAPIPYSFYLIDNDLFIANSKISRSREIKPSTLHYKRTNHSETYFNYVEKELEILIGDEEVVKVLKTSDK